MSEETPNQVDNNATQGATAEPKTFTQAEMDAIIGERLGRLKAKYADYDEAKAALDELNQLKEASKTELQKAVEERDKLKAKLDKLEADAARAEKVAKVAAEKGVDAALLSRMSGDVDENAEFLASKGGSSQLYTPVPDFGEAKTPQSKKSTAAMFADAMKQFNQ